MKSLINSVGIYITRDGTRVNISEVGVSPKDCMAFKCKGHIEREFRGAMRFNKWGIWHESGAFTGLPGHSLDIVSKE